MNFEPNIGEFVVINGLTRVIVEPYTDAVPTRSAGPSSTITKEWTDTFHVQFFDSNELAESSKCNPNSECSNLTKVEFINEQFINEASQQLQMYKYLVSIEALESPIQTQAQKESATSPLKKFINSISSSYSSGFLEDRTSRIKVWAVLTTTDIMWKKSENRKPRLKMSSFLRRQLRLFQVNPKVLVFALPISSELEQKCFSTSTQKTVKLKTSYSKNVCLFE